MNYLDLFHGIGGFALGAYWAGMKFKNHYCSDIVPYCQELYKKRFPDSIQLGDITKIYTTDLPNGEWIITGGFPCQDISTAGKGEGIHGKRSGLWFEMWRIIRDLQPRFAIMENVGAIAIRGLTEVLGSLAEIGYNAEWQDIRAEDVGAPHRRERIWILAYPDLSGLEKRKSKPGNYEQKFAAIMRSCSKWWDQDPADLPDTELRGCGFQGTKLLQDSERPESHTAGNLSERKSKTKIWSAQSHVGRVANGIPGRVDRLKGLGNSIVPQIAEILFKLIKEYL